MGLKYSITCAITFNYIINDIFCFYDLIILILFFLVLFSYTYLNIQLL